MHLHVNLCATARPVSRSYRCRWSECVYILRLAAVARNAWQHWTAQCPRNGIKLKRRETHEIHEGEPPRKKKLMCAHGNGTFGFNDYRFRLRFYSLSLCSTIETGVYTKITRKNLLSKCTSARELSQGTKGTEKQVTHANGTLFWSPWTVNTKQHIPMMYYVKWINLAISFAFYFHWPKEHH